MEEKREDKKEFDGTQLIEISTHLVWYADQAIKLHQPSGAGQG